MDMGLSKIIKSATIVNGNTLIVKFGCLLSAEQISELQSKFQSQVEAIKVIVIDSKCTIEVVSTHD